MVRLPRAISVTAGALVVLIWIRFCRFREEGKRKQRPAVSDGRAAASKAKPSFEKLNTKIAVPERSDNELVNLSTVEDDVESCTTPSFNGSWVNHDSGEVHTVQGAMCSAGNFTLLPDGKGCILDAHGEVHRGELSCDGWTITWENNDTWRRKGMPGPKFDKAALGTDSVQPSVVVLLAVESVMAQPVKASASVRAAEKTLAKGQQQPVARSGSRFDGLWTNHATGEVHTVEGNSCSAGKFTAEADGKTCSLDVHGEVRRGELSSDGRTIAWENDEMWFCDEAPVALATRSSAETMPVEKPMRVRAASRCGFDGCWTNHDTGDRYTIQDACCNIGKFTAAADGLHCSLGVDGDTYRGELSSDGRSIAWENDMTWFRD